MEVIYQPESCVNGEEGGTPITVNGSGGAGGGGGMVTYRFGGAGKADPSSLSFFSSPSPSSSSPAASSSLPRTPSLSLPTPTTMIPTSPTAATTATTAHSVVDGRRRVEKEEGGLTPSPLTSAATKITTAAAAATLEEVDAVEAESPVGNNNSSDSAVRVVTDSAPPAPAACHAVPCVAASRVLATAYDDDFEDHPDHHHHRPALTADASSAHRKKGDEACGAAVVVVVVAEDENDKTHHKKVGRGGDGVGAAAVEDTHAFPSSTRSRATSGAATHISCATTNDFNNNENWEPDADEDAALLEPPLSPVAERRTIRMAFFTMFPVFMAYAALVTLQGDLQRQLGIVTSSTSSSSGSSNAPSPPSPTRNASSSSSLSLSVVYSPSAAYGGDVDHRVFFAGPEALPCAAAVLTTSMFASSSSSSATHFAGSGNNSGHGGSGSNGSRTNDDDGENSRRSYEFSFAASLCYAGNLVFRLMHNILLSPLTPRRRVYLAYGCLVVATGGIALLYYVLELKTLAGVYVAYILGGAGIGTFESNLISVITPLGHGTKVWAQMGIPIGFNGVSVGAFILFAFFPHMPALQGMVYGVIAFSNILGLFFFMFCIPDVHFESTDRSLAHFWSDMKHFRKWAPQLWRHAAALMADMFSLAFNSAIQQYIYTSPELPLFTFAADRVRWPTIPLNVHRSLYGMCALVGDAVGRKLAYRTRGRYANPLFFMILSAAGIALVLSKQPLLALVGAVSVMLANGSVYAHTTKYVDDCVDRHYNLSALSLWLFVGDIGSFIGANIVKPVHAAVGSV